MGRTRVAVLGFGEVGVATSIVIAKDYADAIEVVQILNMNSSPEDAWARVVQSRYVDPAMVSYQDGQNPSLEIMNHKILITNVDSTPDAACKLEDVDILVHTIGEYDKDQALMAAFLEPGRAKAIIVTYEKAAAGGDNVPEFNHESVNVAQHRRFSLGSSTENTAIPILAAIEEACGKGAIRGLYARSASRVTEAQALGVGEVESRKEGVLSNFIPTTTGLSRLLGYPGFFDTMGGSPGDLSIRTPTEDASLLCMSDHTTADRELSTQSISGQFRSPAAIDRWRGIMGYRRHASVVFETQLKFLPKEPENGQRSPISSISVMATYANVYGYSSQVVRGILALSLGRPLSA